MICFNPKCKKEIQVTAGYFILALDRPYMNLYFHKKCVTEDLEILEEIVREQNKILESKVRRK